MTGELRALYGTDEPPARSRRLRAGPLEADLASGQLRTIRFAGVEVIRAIAYVVRDRDWGTYDLGVEDPAVEEGENGFAVSWRAVCTAPDGARLALDAVIRADASGLSFEVSALPDGAFETNRCGFCVLHPIVGVSGRPVSVTHCDGTVEDSVFPDLIEPWQPFKDMAAIRHEATAGVMVTCRMEGDAFEMEDQRAWSDASYKTYVRPLARPWPYCLPAGETNRQRIVLEIAADAATATDIRADAPIALSLDAATGERFPAFGVCIAPEDAADILARPERLGELAPRHLLLHFDRAAGHGEGELRALARVRDLLPDVHAMLEYVVPGERDPEAELGEAARLVAGSGLRPEAVTVGPSVDRQSTPPGSSWPPCPPLADVYASARRAFPGIRLGGGMFSYFTELNRKRPPVETLDYLTHATCPIVHAADDLSVMQTLEALPAILRSARAIIGPDKPYHLGPTTIGMRQNPYGSRTMPNPQNRRVAMAADDPRGRGLFGAAWLVGYAARLAGARLERWTGTAMAGPRGLAMPDGTVTPAFHVAADIAAASGRPLRALRSTQRDLVDGFAFETQPGAVALRIANLTEAPQRVLLPGGEGSWTGSVLGADGTRRVVRAGAGIELPPYAVAFLDSPPASFSSAN